MEAPSFDFAEYCSSKCDETFRWNRRTLHCVLAMSGVHLYCMIHTAPPSGLFAMIHSFFHNPIPIPAFHSVSSIHPKFAARRPDHHIQITTKNSTSSSSGQIFTCRQTSSKCRSSPWRRPPRPWRRTCPRRPWRPCRPPCGSRRASPRPLRARREPCR